MPPEGAPAPEEQGAAPEQGGGEDPVMQLAQMAQQALESKDCNAAMAACEGLLQLLSQGQEGGGEGAAPQGAPVYKKGGVLIKRI